MKRTTGWILLWSVVFVLAGCSPADRAEAPDLSIELSEWEIDVSPASVVAGRIELDVTNTGVLLHELVVFKVDSGGAQWTTAGGIVDLGQVEGELVGEVAELSPADDISASLDLEEGRYVLFCNFAGHYDAGMYQILEVRG